MRGKSCEPCRSKSFSCWEDELGSLRRKLPQRNRLPLSREIAGGNRCCCVANATKLFQGVAAIYRMPSESAKPNLSQKPALFAGCKKFFCGPIGMSFSRETALNPARADDANCRVLCIKKLVSKQLRWLSGSQSGTGQPLIVGVKAGFCELSRSKKFTRRLAWSARREPEGCDSVAVVACPL